MRYALMQPYFLPYPGYLSLIAATDRWVVFDQAQFIKGGWIARNRVLKPGGGWQYVTVPLARFASDARIIDVDVASDPRWRLRILNQLRHYQKKAPFYDDVMSLLSAAFKSPNRRIAKMDVDLLRRLCSYLDIDFEPDFLSEMGLDIPPHAGPGDWGWIVGEQIGARTYVNPPGGARLFNPDAFARVGMEVEIRSLRPTPYEQLGGPFEPFLSTIDLLMFNSPTRARELINMVDSQRLSEANCGG